MHFIIHINNKYHAQVRRHFKLTHCLLISLLIARVLVIFDQLTSEAKLVKLTLQAIIATSLSNEQPRWIHNITIIRFFYLDLLVVDFIPVDVSKPPMILNVICPILCTQLHLTFVPGSHALSLCSLCFVADIIPMLCC